MPKSKYMALEDFQTLWTNTLKPAIPSLTPQATDAEAEAAAEELT